MDTKNLESIKIWSRNHQNTLVGFWEFWWDLEMCQKAWCHRGQPREIDFRYYALIPPPPGKLKLKHLFWGQTKLLRGRFPQICTVCYSVTFKNPNIGPWSWRKIVDNTFSVCTNNIKKHIGSPPRSFISFLQFILVKGMSHCNICWFKYFGNVKKDNYSAKI